MVFRDGNHIRIKFWKGAAPLTPLPFYGALPMRAQWCSLSAVLFQELKKEYHKDIENMKKTLITILAAVPALICAGACTDFLYEGEVDLTPKEEEEFVYPTTYEFNHPCAFVSQTEIDRVKAAVEAADANDPVYVSWQQLCGNQYAQKTYVASPVETLVRGDATNTGVSGENYINACRDAAAAFQLGLRYRITGDSDCAAAAVKILNDWADVCKQITANDNNQYLAAGFQGYQFANAAELLRDYEG